MADLCRSCPGLGETMTFGQSLLLDETSGIYQTKTCCLGPEN